MADNEEDPDFTIEVDDILRDSDRVESDNEEGCGWLWITFTATFSSTNNAS